MKPTIVIGVSSGIAAYKVVDLVKNLKNRGYEIHIIMTQNAMSMVSADEFREASGNEINSTLFPINFDYKKVMRKKEVKHIQIADSASLFVIAPATANIIGKLANGIADDFLSTSLLATTAPILLCPSMNVHMWKNPIVQDNIKKLSRYGFQFLHPDSGTLACGYTGVGRLASIEKIENKILQILAQKTTLQGKKIIVTAGGTSESIDTVRVITNRSSGKMGVALAEECYLLGADVFLIRSVTSVLCRYPVEEEKFETGEKLSDLIKKYSKVYDVIFHTAAVSDFIPEKKFDEKIESKKALTIKLNIAPKILHMIKTWNPMIKVIGFKAVYKKTEKECISIGLQKLKVSRSDYVIVNDIGKEGIGFGAEDNEVYIISRNGLIAKIEKAPKAKVARKILYYIFNNEV